MDRLIYVAGRWVIIGIIALLVLSVVKHIKWIGGATDFSAYLRRQNEEPRAALEEGFAYLSLLQKKAKKARQQEALVTLAKSEMYSVERGRLAWAFICKLFYSVCCAAAYSLLVIWATYAFTNSVSVYGLPSFALQLSFGVAFYVLLLSFLFRCLAGRIERVGARKFVAKNFPEEAKAFEQALVSCQKKGKKRSQEE